MRGASDERTLPRRPTTRRLLTAVGLSAQLIAGCGGEPAAEQGRASTAEERLLAWEAENPEAPAQAALGFGRPVPDSALVNLLGRHRLRPYALFLAAGGMASEQRVPKSDASLELVARSREEALGQLRVSLCAQPNRARVMLEDSPTLLADQAAARRVAAVLTYVDRLQTDMRALATGAPLFYGVEVVGSPDDLRATASDPLLGSFEPGEGATIEGERRIVVPQPELEPGWADLGIAPEYLAMDLGALSARFQELAQGIEGCDGVEQAPPGS